MHGEAMRNYVYASLVLKLWSMEMHHSSLMSQMVVDKFCNDRFTTKTKEGMCTLEYGKNMHVSFMGDTCLFSRYMSGHHRNARAGMWTLLLMVYLMLLLYWWENRKERDH
jgi:hypothetical protein